MSERACSLGSNVAAERPTTTLFRAESTIPATSARANTLDLSMSGLRLSDFRRAEYGTHSLRRTKASMIYKATSNLRAIQILLGHTKIENTVRYLGVDIEDALTLAERTEI